MKQLLQKIDDACDTVTALRLTFSSAQLDRTREP
jgi:hypothetical protein